MFDHLQDIPNFSSWILIFEIKKGSSKDQKYYIEDQFHQSFYLKISSIDLYEEKKKEFENAQYLNKIQVEIQKAIGFGKCNQNQNVYLLFTWINGLFFKQVLPIFSKQKQYQWGLKAGLVLKKIHSLPVKRQEIISNTDRINKSIKEYCNSKVRFDEYDKILQYITYHINQLNQLPPVYRHGAFHANHLLFTKKGSIGVIDFSQSSYGDPYEDFTSVFVDTNVSYHFAIGKIDGYFGKVPDRIFWRTFSVYSAIYSLLSIVAVKPFNKEKVKRMQEHCKKIMKDFDDYKVIMPIWYKEGRKELL